MEGRVSREIAHTLSEYIEKKNWNFELDQEEGVFRLGFAIKDHTLPLRYFICVHEDYYLVYAVWPYTVDVRNERQLRRMAECIGRINSGLLCGSFELNYKSGHISYKCYVGCAGILPTPAMFEESMYVPMMAYHRYSDGLLAVLEDRMSAKRAVDACEAADDPA